MSETAKHRPLVAHLAGGNGIDIGSAGDPLTPWCIQIELSAELYRLYNSTRPEARLHWHADDAIFDLPFKDGTLDFLHASHLLEDFDNWDMILREWDRVLKTGGYLIIAVPDHDRFRAYVQRHLPIDVDNKSHKRESFVGELTKCLGPHYTTILDRFVSENPQEYSIIYAGRKNN
jgi:ubiquinone/menaquinone biosynthesis C-methylase UbiE